MRFIGLLCLLSVTGGICVGQDTNFLVGPQYLITGDSMLLHPIATPTLTLGTPLPAVSGLSETVVPVENVASSASSAQAPQVNLFSIYYGYPRASEIELTSTEQTPELPASITNVGVEGVTDAQTLRELGYGIPLGDTAAYWKAHKAHAPRIYTNADIQRLHPS